MSARATPPGPAVVCAARAVVRGLALAAARGRAARAAVRWLVIAAAWAWTGAARAAPESLGPPVPAASGAVAWTRPALAAAPADTVAFWRAAAATPGLGAFALDHLGALALAAGDSVRADSLWALPALTRSIQAWDALRARVDLAVARGAPARADSLLEAAGRSDWPDLERAAWLARRVGLRAQLGDTTRAIGFARQTLRVYPSLAPASRVLAQFEALMAARRESLSLEDERVAVEVEVLRGDRAAAARRLRRIAGAAAGPERGAIALRLVEVERGARRVTAAAEAARAALAGVLSDSLRARMLLELARVHRDAGRVDSALATFRRAADRAVDAATAETARWEEGRAAEDEMRWPEALASFRGVATLGLRRAEDAAFRTGLMHFMMDRNDSACAWWGRGTGEAARFWWGVATRRVDRAAGDSALARLAGRPGYTFYRAAARDTLGLRGWPGGVATDSCGGPPRCAVLRAASALASAGAADDAFLLLSRWVSGDARVAATRPGPRDLLAASRLAFALGRVAPGIGYAERAMRLLETAPDSLQWVVVPWGFPPAYAAWLGPRGADEALEPALLLALVRQESRFDPGARSASDALGLMQLKFATAREVARELRLAVPTEAGLMEPELNLKLGMRYLTKLVRRFDGDVVAALCAYNAGASTLGPDWRAVAARGGDALLCELASNNDARDYARKIMAGRQAYRELRPFAE